MKSEPRHEKKTASPKTPPGQEPLETPGDYWRVYGNRILLVLIAILAVFLAIRYYREKQTNDALALSTSLENVRTQMGNLQQVLLSAGNNATPETITTRDRVVSQLSDSINSVLETAKDPKIIARGYLYKGDMKWELANAPDPAGATTRPELKVQNRDSLLDEAKDAYSHVLESPFSDDPLSLFSGRIGLAAIAENQHKWDVAKSQYQSVVDSSLPASFKELARKRLVELPDLQKTPVLNAAPEMGDLKSLLESMAKTQPGTTFPSSSSSSSTTMPGSVVPSSMPATMPMIEMTAPATPGATSSPAPSSMPSASVPAASMPADTRPAATQP